MKAERVAKLYYSLFCGEIEKDRSMAFSYCGSLWRDDCKVLLRKPATDLFRLPLMFTLHRFYIFLSAKEH